MSAPSVFTISDLAREFGVTPRTIRFYEDKDLLLPRRDGQTRIYSPRDRARLALILRGKRVGFSLAEIKDMLDLYDLGDNQVAQLRTTFQKCRQRIDTLLGQRHDIDATIAELEQYCAEISRILAAKSACLDEAGVS